MLAGHRLAALFISLSPAFEKIEPPLAPNVIEDVIILAACVGLCILLICIGICCCRKGGKNEDRDTTSKYSSKNSLMFRESD